MTELRTVLDQLAADAPTLDEDAADRAIARGRRRHRIRRITLPTAGGLAFAATMAVIVMIATQIGPFRPDVESIRSLDDSWLVNVPEEPPKPLPTRAVGPVDLAYNASFDMPPLDGNRCQSWWLIQADGDAWRLTDVYWSDNAYGCQSVMLSPSGDRIAYQRASDRAAIIRDFTTGDVTVVSEHGSVQPVAWSHNGRWLVLDGRSLDSGFDDPNAKLVDTATGKVTDLGRPAPMVRGVSDAGEPIAMDSRGCWEGGDCAVLLVNKDGSVRKTLDYSFGSGPGSALGYSTGLLSPDGKGYVAHLPGSEDTASPGKLVEFDAMTGDLERRIEIDKPDTRPGDLGLEVRESFGWFDETTLLAVPTRDNEAAHTVYGIDVRTGKVRKLIEFTGTSPYDLSLATDR